MLVATSSHSASRCALRHVGEDAVPAGIFPLDNHLLLAPKKKTPEFNGRVHVRPSRDERHLVSIT